MSHPSRVALITGGARRVGAAFARHLHTKGYTILIHYHHSSEAAQQLVEQLNRKRANSAACVCANLLDDNSHSTISTYLLQKFGRCDVLINNASSFYATPLSNASAGDWNDLMGSNLKAPYFLSQSLSESLRQNNGCIVNLADINGFRPRPDYSIYCMAKAANIMMTKSLALELAPRVRVNGIAPGAILWPENEHGELIENTDQLQHIPMKTLGGAESLCKTLDLLIDTESYLTGEVITVDGGRTIAPS